MQNRTSGSKAALSKAAVIVLLSVPAWMSIAPPKPSSVENRTLAVFPSPPTTWDTALAYPAKLDVWINDHFGFRDRLIKLNNKIRHALFRQFPTIQVIQGKGERLFLSAHATTHPPYSAILLSCGYGNSLDTVVQQLNRFEAVMRTQGADAKLLVAPSGPTLYPNELPAWLEARCRPDLLPVPRILASSQLDPSAKSLVYYPLQEMRAIRGRTSIIPNSWFHWNGAGLAIVVEASVHALWGKSPNADPPLKTRNEYLKSDISHLFPGVHRGDEVEIIDFTVSGISQCLGGACFPELRPVMEKLSDVSRYRNPRGHGRLILVSDSFGSQIAGWYARHFAEVVHVSTNYLERLDKSELAQLRHTIVGNAGQDKVLFLYHDGTLLYGRLGLDLDKLGL